MLWDPNSDPKGDDDDDEDDDEDEDDEDDDPIPVEVCLFKLGPDDPKGGLKDDDDPWLLVPSLFIDDNPRPLLDPRVEDPSEGEDGLLKTELLEPRPGFDAADPNEPKGLEGEEEPRLLPLTPELELGKPALEGPCGELQDGPG